MGCPLKAIFLTHSIYMGSYFCGAQVCDTTVTDVLGILEFAALHAPAVDSRITLRVVPLSGAGRMRVDHHMVILIVRNACQPL